MKKLYIYTITLEKNYDVSLYIHKSCTISSIKKFKKILIIYRLIVNRKLIKKPSSLAMRLFASINFTCGRFYCISDV